jgi:hypothetical protein
MVGRDDAKLRLTPSVSLDLSMFPRLSHGLA